MTITPNQTRRAVLSTRITPVTHGARVRAALLHIRYSRNEKPAGARRASQIIVADDIAGATDE